MGTSNLTFFDKLSYAYDNIFYFGYQASNRQKLMFYIKNKDYKKVSYFIESGVPLNFTRGYDTPLTIAVYQNDEKMVEILLKAQETGINRPYSAENATPLVFSAQSGNVKIAELLLKHGADPYIKDEMNCDALCYAQKHHHDDIVKLIGEYTNN